MHTSPKIRPPPICISCIQLSFEIVPALTLKIIVIGLLPIAFFNFDVKGENLLLNPTITALVDFEYALIYFLIQILKDTKAFQQIHFYWHSKIL